MVMHPADLAMQMSGELKVQLQGALVSQNIDTGAESLKTMKKLFDENNTDGRYDFDVDFFHQMGGLTANASWKACNNARVLSRIIDQEMDMENLLDSDEEKEQLYKSLFGREDIIEVAQKELEEAREKDPDLQFSAGGFYLYNHPEVINMKNFRKKTKSGKYVFGAEMESNARSYMNAENLYLIRELMNGNKIKPLNEKELEKYEKSLESRKMPKLITKEDPYGINAYKKRMETYIVRDKDNKPVLDKKGKIKMIDVVKLEALQWEEN